MIADPLWLVPALALALGVRHALEPDHLVAVTTLFAADADAPMRAAGRLGIAWGAGHCVTIVAFGVPAVLLAAEIPAVVGQSAEVAAGVLIVLLALRVLVRWRRGRFHVHEHDHDGVRHAHLHAHEGGSHVHAHARRTAFGAFGLGLVHGAGGGAGATVLVVAGTGSKTASILSLVVLGTGAAVAMALLCVGLAFGLHGRAARRRLARLVPAVALLSLVFGVYYTVGALGA